MGEIGRAAILEAVVTGPIGSDDGGRAGDCDGSAEKSLLGRLAGCKLGKLLSRGGVKQIGRTAGGIPIKGCDDGSAA